MSTIHVRNARLRGLRDAAEARLAGLPLPANPYRRDTKSHIFWQQAAQQVDRV